MKEALKQIQEEYDRCLKFVENPQDAPELYGINGLENVRNYYSYRVEGLGFALDRLRHG